MRDYDLSELSRNVNRLAAAAERANMIAEMVLTPEQRLDLDHQIREKNKRDLEYMQLVWAKIGGADARTV